MANKSAAPARPAAKKREDMTPRERGRRDGEVMNALARKGRARLDNPPTHVTMRSFDGGEIRVTYEEAERISRVSHEFGLGFNPGPEAVAAAKAEYAKRYGRPAPTAPRRADSRGAAPRAPSSAAGQPGASAKAAPARPAVTRETLRAHLGLSAKTSPHEIRRQAKHVMPGARGLGSTPERMAALRAHLGCAPAASSDQVMAVVWSLTTLPGTEGNPYLKRLPAK